jgi:SAM-dependent methyltransferase
MPIKIFYDKRNKRLVYLGQGASPSFWESHWEKNKFKDSVERGKESRLILGTLKKYIPDKKGLILDGGCGNGQIVYSMQAHGYRGIGVDYAEKTVKMVNETFPELDVKWGDVRNLQFPDNHFAGYWSLGVIEHFVDGYIDVLKEIRRVLVNGGYLFMSIPSMAPLRRLKAKLGLYRELTGRRKGSLYQYVLSPDAVLRDLEANGFELIEKRPLSGLKGFKDEVNLLRPLLQKLHDYKGQSFWINGFRYGLDNILASFAGHMTFLVLRNNKD